MRNSIHSAQGPSFPPMGGRARVGMPPGGLLMPLWNQSLSVVRIVGRVVGIDGLRVKAGAVGIDLRRRRCQLSHE